MNQKNLFTGISAVLILQGIAFYFMHEQLAQQSFPGLAAEGVAAVGAILTVAGLMSVLIGLVVYATRNYPGVLGAMSLGISLLTLNTMKHYFIDKLAVPIPALIIQVLISLICIYLLTQKGKSTTS